MTPDQPIPDDAFVDGLLTPAPVRANDALKASILQDCSNRLRWRRRTRLVARTAVLAACFMGGMGTMALWPASTVVEKRMFVRVVEDPAPAQPTPVQPQPPAPNRPRPLSPAELELAAERSLVKAESARQFREAGDGYLFHEANYQAALRCYRNFLDEADGVDLNPSPRDTWLLASLISARKKENANVQADR